MVEALSLGLSCFGVAMCAALASVGDNAQGACVIVASACVLGVCAIEAQAAARKTAARELRWSARRRRYELSASRGFLPAQALSVAVDDSLEELARRLPELNRNGYLHQYVATTEIEVNVAALWRRPEALRRAYAILGACIQSYAYRHLARWDDDRREEQENSPAVVPASLAKPWISVCDLLDLPYGACATAGLDLWNWADDSFTTRIASMTGTETEVAFHSLAAKIIERSARDLPALLDIVDDLEAGRIRLVLGTLDAVGRMLVDMRKLFEDVWRSVDPDTFFYVLRPLLSGSTPDNPLRLQLADGSVRQVTAAGPSGSQSTIFLLLDALLLDDDDDRRPHVAFQRAMLAHMPLAHRALAVNFERRLGASALKTRRGRVGRAVRRARVAYAAFRRFHFAVAVRYLRCTAAGTGGSEFRAMLQDGIARTTTA